MSLDCGRRRVDLLELSMERLVHERETPGDSAMTSFLYILDFVRMCGRCEVFLEEMEKQSSDLLQEG